MKKFLSVIFILMLIFISGCGKKEEEVIETTDALKFKEEYETLNGETSSSGKQYSNLSINEDNPVKYSSYDEVIDVINNGTGIIYLGYPECPWCRSALPVLLDAVSDYGIDKIYYLNMKNERDYLTVSDGKIVYDVDKDGNEIKGSEGYFRLLDVLDEHLDEYVINDNGKDYYTGEKRIYVPLIIFVNEGEVVGTHTSTVDSQVSGYNQLTEEQYDELSGIYADYIKELVDNYCDSAC